MYDRLIDIFKIEKTYHDVRLKTRHKNKIVNFELFYMTNIMSIYNVLKNKTYMHGFYNIFLIKEPKYRIVMSENISDKIINHLISVEILLPIIEPKLVYTNVATRKNKGLKCADVYLKKYLNTIKKTGNNIYILKCDIKKYFYSIDHEILKNKLKRVINDEDVINIINNIIDTTNDVSVNKKINNLVKNEKNFLEKKFCLSKVKNRIEELNNIPLYKYNKGISIGNMTSQIFAIFYLNDLDHFIKEKLKVKYYIRYMDDSILIHNDKTFLKYCLEEIQKFLLKEKLELNKKTQIINIKNGLNFLGYKYFFKNNKLIKIMNPSTKRRIVKSLKRISKLPYKNNVKSAMASYNGYFKKCNCKSFIYKNKWLKLIR